MLRKRLTSIFLSLFIVIGVVASDYSTVMAVDIPTAFWGTLEYSRAFFTAMQAGGALDRGINFEDFTKSNQRQWMDLAPKVMEAYQLFCFYKEKVIVSAEHPNWTMEQINSEAVTRSFKLKDDFVNNAINVQSTTGKITLKDWGYWQEFCKEFSSIAKNGLGQNTMEPTTVISPKIANADSIGITAKPKTNVGSNTIDYNDHFYLDSGEYGYNDTHIYPIGVGSNVPTDRVRIPFFNIIKVSNSNYMFLYCTIDVNRLSGDIIGKISWNSFYDNQNVDFINNVVARCNLPMHCTTDSSMGTSSATYTWANDYVNNLSVATGGEQALDWQYKAQEALDDSDAGSAIKKGNTAQKTKTVVREGSVPIKRSSLKEEEQDGTKVVSGEIGWDIPQSKVIEGTIANPAEEDEEIRQIGVIDVPAEDIIDRPEEDDIVIPADTPIVVPEDEVIDGPVEPIPIVNIFEIQYGPFYPTAMQSIEEFFPFCIPFDIYYCIQKFNVEPGEAPILHLAIPIPRQLQSRLGVTYDVNVDLNDYVLIRDIIRYFILLSFMVGLMTLTRDIIRG